MKEILKKFPHIKYLVLYAIFYLCFFCFLEQREGIIFNTETFIDQYIPFNEYFVVFYVFWFIYMGLAIFYYTFIEVKSFKRVAKYLMIGMTTCLVFCLLVPNGIYLRPELTNKNIFEKLVSLVYKADTSTNVFPSIHAYNSVVVAYSLNDSDLLRDKSLLKILNIIIAILICMSTVFLKQHAIIDVLGALILAFIIVTLVNRQEKKRIPE